MGGGKEQLLRNVDFYARTWFLHVVFPSYFSVVKLELKKSQVDNTPLLNSGAQSRICLRLYKVSIMQDLPSVRICSGRILL